MALIRNKVVIPVGQEQAHEAEFVSFSGLNDDKEHVALVFKGADKEQNVPLVRLHSECLTGDVFHSARCDCGKQLDEAVESMAKQGGILLYLRQEGRGIGLLEKLRAYNLQDEGFDTVDANLMLGHEADGRDYTLAALMLKDLGVRAVLLMTNNPEKINALRTAGIDVRERVSLEVAANADNAEYLLTKAKRMNHLLQLKTAG